MKFFIKLSRSKLRVLSSVCINFAQVFLASLVIPFFTGDIDIGKSSVLVFGLIATIFFIGIGLIFGERGKV